MKAMMVLVGLAALAQGVQGVDFYAHWGDGRAEISSYAVVQPRYGEMRQGSGVMIFVTEDINRNTLIKVESPTPKEDRLYTLKLNNVLKFTTGIYDYSVMTSVFSQVEGEAGSFALKKITLTAQEWCGHVFEEVRLDGDEVEGEINSYFEREGKTAYELDAPENFVNEDHLLIQIRELRGAFMQAGEERSVTLMPSLWHFRTRHSARKTLPATLKKGGVETVQAGGGPHQAVRWSWRAGEYHKTVWVEQAYPHRILAWEDAEGGSGRLQQTVREPYWGMHDNADEVHRKKLQIP